MAQPTTALTIQLSSDLKTRLEQVAQATARSAAWLATEALETYIALQEWQIQEIKAGLREADAGDFASESEVKSVISKWTGDAH